MELWSLLTGLIGIISFLLTLSDRFKHWKKYLIYSGILFVGIFIGQINGSMTGLSSIIINDARIASSLLIIERDAGTGLLSLYSINNTF